MTWWSRLLPAVTFALGLLIGGLLIGLVVSSDDTSQQPGGSSADGQQTPGAAPTTVLVPASCAEAGRQAERAVQLMRDGAAAVRDVQPEKLSQVLNDLEDTQTRLEQVSRACSKVNVESSP